MDNEIASWQCFGCGIPKSNLSDPCQRCDGDSEPTKRVNTKLVQNNVYVHGPFTQSLIDDNNSLKNKINEFSKEFNQAPGRKAQSLGMALFGYTCAAAVWTSLVVIWMSISFFVIVLYKAFFAGQ